MYNVELLVVVICYIHADIYINDFFLNMYYHENVLYDDRFNEQQCHKKFQEQDQLNKMLRIHESLQKQTHPHHQIYG